MAAVGALLILAVWFAQTGLALLAGLFLATAGLARLWCRLSLAGVSAERRFVCRRCFPGETIECTLGLVNRKPLPLPWARVEWPLPPEIHPLSAEPDADSPGVRRSASLFGYRRIKWTIRLSAARRGLYPVGPLSLCTGDIFGLFTRSLTTAAAEPLIVYPHIFPVDTGAIPSLQPMGDHPAPRRMVQDPTCPIGVRDYQRTDNLKFIHWKASARTQELKVKLLAATTAFQAALFLDVEGFHAQGLLAEEDFELAISATGSIAAALAGKGSPVGLYVNACLADTGLPAGIAPGAGRERLTLVLETLAKVTAAPSGPFAAFVEGWRSELPAGTTLVFIAGRPSPGLPLILADLSASGFRILLFSVGDHGEIRLPDNIALRRVRTAADLTARGGGRP